MPPSLPPEILDLIVDFLHDELGALKACCLVSKSWVHRIREHIFADVELSWESHIKLWKKTFPDLSNSPARYTRNLTIYTSQSLTSAGWIRAFSGLVRLEVDVISCGNDEKILVPLRGLSPTLKSLHLYYGSSALFSEIFGLVCSFPLLEDLTLLSLGNNKIDVWDIPSTSPKLTGCLDLNTADGMRPTLRRLLELPGGLRFSKIVITCFDEDVEPVMDLVSECSDTLESLSMTYHNIGAFLSLLASVVNRYLTTTYEYSRGWRASARPLQAHETESGLDERTERPMDHHGAANR